ncbi:MAG: alpha/beta fold hydrolase [Rhodopila sp.]
MTPQDLQIPALDGFPLGATLFQPDGRARGAVIINSALGVRQGFYAPFAAYLCAAGFVVVSYDYRGIGRSRSDMVRTARLRDWGACDFAGVLAWTKAAFPGLALGCVGHSIGGQIVGLTPHSRHLRAFLGVATQSGYWGHWAKRFWPRLLFTWWIAVPVTARLLGRVPGLLYGGEDLPGMIGHDLAQRCRMPHYMSDEEGRAWRPHFDAATCPAAFYVIADDHAYAPLAAARALADCYSAAQSSIEVINPADWNTRSLRHFGFFRRKAPRPLWERATCWLGSHLAPAESAVASRRAMHGDAIWQP